METYLELATRGPQQQQQLEEEEGLLDAMSLDDRKKYKLKKKKVSYIPPLPIMSWTIARCTNSKQGCLPPASTRIWGLGDPQRSLSIMPRVLNEIGCYTYISPPPGGVARRLLVKNITYYQQLQVIL